MTDAATTDTPVTPASATEQTLERDTAVAGTPPGKDENADASAPAEGGNDVPPPTEGSPEG